MLGTRIAALRRCRGLTQQQLAQQLRVSPSTVGMYEQGRREPPLDILLRLSALLDVTADFLLTGEICGKHDCSAAAAIFQEAERSLGELYLCSAAGAKVLFSRKDLAMLIAAAICDKRD